MDTEEHFRAKTLTQEPWMPIMNYGSPMSHGDPYLAIMIHGGSPRSHGGAF